MAGSPWESSNVLVPAARPKMPRRAYEFRQGRLRRAYEFSPSARGELWNSTRACLDVGSVCSLHVRGHTRAHTQLSKVWQSPRAACSSMQQRAQDLCPCVHAPESCCRLSPESCCRQLLTSASHCRDWHMVCVARGRIVIVIAPSKCRGELMRAICSCR